MNTFLILVLCLTFSFFCLCNCGNSGNILTEKLPPIYNTDFTRCTNDTNGRYCIAHIKLKPIGKEPSFWNVIEQRRKSRLHFDPSSVHRGICIPRLIPENQVNTSIKQILEAEFFEYNLDHEIYMLECKSEPKPTSKLMNIIGIFGIFYLVLVFLSTMYDVFFPPSKSTLSKLNKWFLFLSIKSNWDKLVNHKKTNPDYEKLEFFQGVRFYTMNLVLFCHHKLSWGTLFITNPYFIEYIMNNKIFQIPVSVDFFVVQIFFLISSWLITNQILEIHRRNGEFTAKDGAILLFNRVMRYLPTLTVLTLITVSPLGNSDMCEGTLMFGFIRQIQKTCVDNWWMTLLQINNFAGEVSKICYIGTWYLSIDTQYYLITILVLYVILKYNCNPTKIMAAVILTALTVHAAKMYVQNLKSIQWMNLETLKRHRFMQDPIIESQYFSFYSSWGTSLIGTCLGMVYFYTKNSEKVQPMERVLYSSAMLVLPTAAILMTLFPVGPSLWASIIGATIKPLWSLGIGLGFLGISRNAMPGIFRSTKTICQSRYAVLLGNFSYSTYLIHFPIVFMKGLYEMTEANFTSVVFNLLRDLVSSWTAGVMFALLIEQPGINVLKEFLPEVRRKKIKSYNGDLNHRDSNSNCDDILTKNFYKNK